MAWTAPMTAVDLDPFTAGEFNTHIRDNLLETMPARAGMEGDYFVTLGTNSIDTRRVQESSFLVGEGLTTSTSYTDLPGTVGPSVTLDVGTTALVIIGAQSGPFDTGTPNLARSVLMSFEVEGPSASPALDIWAFGETHYASVTARTIGSRAHFLTGMTPGTHTFTCKYKVGSGTGSITGTWSERRIIVMPF